MSLFKPSEMIAYWRISQSVGVVMSLNYRFLAGDFKIFTDTAMDLEIFKNFLQLVHFFGEINA